MPNDGSRLPGTSKPRRVSALDVARLAGVSRSAVSRTYTPGAVVAAQTRARVLRAAEALGYRPNLLARGLITSRTGLIAIVLANLNSPFFSEFVSRLTVELRGRTLRTLLLVTQPDQPTDEALREALDYSIDGAILISARPSPEVAHAYSQAGVPIVLLDQRDADIAPDIAMVWTDGRIGVDVARIMRRDGRRRPVAMIGAGRAPGDEFLAFAEEMRAAGAEPCRWREVALDYQAAHDTADTLFADPATRPDAIFAATDLMAIGALDAARLAHGLSVPRDLSLVGIGNTPAAAWRSQRLSSVRLPIAGLVHHAVAVLIDRINTPDAAAPRIWLECVIEERGTTNPGVERDA
ncbi:MAG: LacI family DNA-binding transcriptional regulator [Azospirillaceae bacterium]|nr:LacI family DNA-binding transcriptional regulator [Azospirillaceae bacterium]